MVRTPGWRVWTAAAQLTSMPTVEASPGKPVVVRTVMEGVPWMVTSS